MKPLLTCTLLIVFGILLGGCPSLDIETETTIYPDGSALREISIHEIDDPDAPVSVTTLLSSEDVASPEGGEGDLLARLVLPDPGLYISYERKDKSLHAVGRFADPNKIEPDYVQRSQYLEKDSRNSFSFKREDYVLFETFAYSEKYGDIVDRDSYYQGIERGLSLLTELYLGVLEKEYGKDYDLSAFKKALETEILPLLRKVARVNYEVSVRNASLPAEERERIMYQEILPVLSAYGLKLELYETNDERIMEFLASKHVELLKPRRPEVPRLSAQQVRDFFENRVETMFGEAAVEKYGSEEAFEKEVGKVAEEVFGINLSSPSIKFSLEVKMPGILLSSSGAFSGSKAILEFSEEDLYLVGRTLSVVSVLYDGDALDAVSTKPLLTREKIALAEAFLALEPDVLPKVLKAFEQAVASQSLQEVKDLRKKLSPPAARRLDEILRALE